MTSDIDNTALFENTIPDNQNKKGQIRRTPSVLIRLIERCNAVSDKYDSVRKHSQEISELMKLHIRGVWQIAHKFIRQLAHRS